MRLALNPSPSWVLGEVDRRAAARGVKGLSCERKSQTPEHAERYPSSSATRHLLPQGEKGKHRLFRHSQKHLTSASACARLKSFTAEFACSDVLNWTATLPRT